MHSTIYFVAAIAAASANVGSHVRLVITHISHPHYCSPPITSNQSTQYRLLLTTNDPLPFKYITKSYNLKLHPTPFTIYKLTSGLPQRDDGELREPSCRRRQACRSCSRHRPGSARIPGRFPGLPGSGCTWLPRPNRSWIPGRLPRLPGPRCSWLPGSVPGLPGPGCRARCACFPRCSACSVPGSSRFPAADLPERRCFPGCCSCLQPGELCLLLKFKAKSELFDKKVRSKILIV